MGFIGDLSGKKVECILNEKEMVVMFSECIKG